MFLLVGGWCSFGFFVSAALVAFMSCCWMSASVVLVVFVKHLVSNRRSPDQTGCKNDGSCDNSVLAYPLHMCFDLIRELPCFMSTSPGKNCAWEAVCLCLGVVSALCYTCFEVSSSFCVLLLSKCSM